jgi:hypothetical protein
MMQADDAGAAAAYPEGGGGFDHGFAEGMGVDLADAAQGGSGEMEDKVRRTSPSESHTRATGL